MWSGTPLDLLSCCLGDLGSDRAGRFSGQSRSSPEALQGLWSCGQAFADLSLLWLGGLGAGKRAWPGTEAAAPSRDFGG